MNANEVSRLRAARRGEYTAPTGAHMEGLPPHVFRSYVECCGHLYDGHSVVPVNECHTLFFNVL
eukprot:COSAG01_NODE_8421_length_2788_cov_11.979918_4_plen_64_part_00